MTRHLALALTLTPALSFIAAAACTDTASHDGPAVTGGVARLEIPLTLDRDLDLLFVIDNSPGMAPHRARLLDDYRRFIAVLETLRGGPPDLHIGVITTDVGTRGAYDTGPGPSIGTGAGSCTSDGDRGELRRAAAIDGNFLSDVVAPDGSRARNYTGSLADAFVQLADVGAAGCTYARPLEAMRRALGNPANAGFRRDGAPLAVVLLTSDDDCSFGSSSFTGGVLDRSRCTTNAGALVAVDEYVASLASATSSPYDLFVLGGFAPPDQPACADVRPAARLDAFTDGFPDRSHVVSICEPDLSGLLSPFSAAPPPYSSGPPCFGVSLLDVDPVADGLQVECAAWYRYEADGELVEEPIPECLADEPGPCWQIRRDPSCIEGEVVDFRHRLFPSGAGALAIIECVSR
jgi:hypothetical protein